MERQQSLEANQPTRTHLSYVDRLRHVRENNVSESNLAVPSSFSMGAGPGEPHGTGPMYRRREQNNKEILGARLKKLRPVGLSARFL